jgi:hypothetical protein
MRYRLMATYLGAPYQAGMGPGGTEVTLFAACPPPEELGFSSAAGHWRKQVTVTDLDALWQSRPVGEYRGERCLVLDDLGDRLHIAYLGRDAVRARQLGYWEVDREVFEVVVSRHEVIDLTEERAELPLTTVLLPPPRVDPQAITDPWTRTDPTGPHAIADPLHNSGPQPIAGSSPRMDPDARSEPQVPSELPPVPPPAVCPNGDHPSSVPDRVAAWHGSPAPEPWPTPESWQTGGSWPPNGRRTATGESAPTEARSRRATPRESTQSVFAELVGQAAIPRAAYAVGEEVAGAMCLVKTDGGFEVFSRAEDARHEVRYFEDEEAAYFYLFGVLAAEAIRSGRLGPQRPTEPKEHSGLSDPTGNISKYLRRVRNVPKSPSDAARV